MQLSQSRHCPLCGGHGTRVTFPYATRFNNFQFNYLSCGNCSSVFVDPIPDNQTFERMYDKKFYHDCHYDNINNAAYKKAVCLLKKYIPESALVLDYGCGTGEFLKALALEGFIPFGVEFDKSAAQFAAKNAACETLSVKDFQMLRRKIQFDAIHLGDVLEHLPEPDKVLRELLFFLKPGGILFVEGPLETNPSLVYWSVRLFGLFKRRLKPDFIGSHSPTHLFRTNSEQQLKFFSRIEEPALDLKYWRIYETGWPYSCGGVIKKSIAACASILGGRKMFGITFGNRFQGLFIKK